MNQYHKLYTPALHTRGEMTLRIAYNLNDQGAQS